jgi:hypothetical protein
MLVFSLHIKGFSYFLNFLKKIVTNFVTSPTLELNVAMAIDAKEISFDSWSHGKVELCVVYM